MSGNLRLNGATSGYSELAAPDVAGDQTFTFPASGGTLAIASTNSGGQPVPGYQQGTWTPTVARGTGTNMDGHWWRIGNTVTLQGRVAGLSDRAANGIHIWGVPYSPVTYAGGFIGSMMLTQSNGAKHAIYMDTVSEVLQFYQSAASNDTAWTSTAYNNLGSGNDFRFQLTYLTDNTDWTPINGATVS